jgi:Family of unknown function (DUF6267)
MKLDFLNSILTEAADASPRIPHPEDTIFDGLAAAQRYVQALKDVIKNPGKISIKWDGGIALVFGRKTSGEFFCADKYMPNKGVLPTSPKQWVEYDQSRGANRNDLYAKIETIWKGLEADVVQPGTYKGDLMSVGKTPMVDGMYEFKPTTVTYRFPPKSPIGKIIANKVGVIVVHQQDGAPWDGRTGLQNNGNVAVLNPTAGLRFSLRDPVQLSNAATKTVTGATGQDAEQFLKGMDGVAQAAIKKYFNHKITGQTNEDEATWLQKNVSGKQYKNLIGDNQDGYLYQNKKGYDALRATWNAIYVFKVNLADQLEKQVTGFEQWTGGQKAGEGFVVDTPIGLVKLVNRGVFGVAHFNK